MKKVILVDGNNLMFRSFYATLYSGSVMTNKEGFPTNALYGFVNMMHKIIDEEKPEYIMVAFDIGKTFRHEKYDYYKGKRDETPDDLKKQFPVAKKILNAMGIKYFELAGYEADDIIGTFAKKVDENDNFIATIISSDKDNAYMSYDIATIYREVPVDTDFNNIKYTGEETEELINIYNDLDFHSFLRKTPKKQETKNIEYDVVTDTTNLKLSSPIAINLELDVDNYHSANIVGLSLYNDTTHIYIKGENLTNTDFLKDINVYTYNYKKLYSSLKRRNMYIPNCIMDTMLAGYLLNYSVKDDPAYLANSLDYDIQLYDKKLAINSDEYIKRSINISKFIYETYDNLLTKMKDNNVLDLYQNIELPLSTVLAKMELNGIRIDKSILETMKTDIKEKIDDISQKIYNLAGREFNIASPKQLGEVLFDELKLPHAKKNKTGYVTDANVLGKLIEYPIVRLILEYRLLNKLYTTYLEGILNSVAPDGKIHTIYTQTLTRTGRLSSIEPNLQNIPVRNEFGKLIRKAFVPEDDSLILSSDYSQIELRIFAHLAKVDELINAFKNNMDIHTKTAMDIFKVSEDNVTKDMRRQAKAVNFGILYGISPFGLAEDIGISPKEAKKFIETYFETYPGIKDYMNKEIEEAHKNGYVLTIMNRKRTIEELKSSNYMQRSMGERMALNTPIQGSSADILKKAMIEIDEAFEKEKIASTMLLQVHDELIFNVKKNELEKVKEIVKNIMENTIKLSVPLVVDIETGTNWYDAK